jgi:hypothetical protein
MDTTALILAINKDLELSLPADLEETLMRQQLAAYLNQLILADFQKLVYLLYRIDVDEMKLKKMLRDFPDQDAGLLMADMVIERERKKAETRMKFKRNVDSEEDLW